MLRLPGPAAAIVGTLALLAGAPLRAHADDAKPDAADPAKPGVGVAYGDQGLEVTTTDGRFRAWFGLRVQLRFSHPFADDPTQPEDFSAPDDSSFPINRARFKWGGHAYRKWLDYYLELDLKSARLLDLRFTFERHSAVQFRVGQWKAEYNRERRDSSGEQQLVDRSIVNHTFTIDRQPGVMVFGRLWAGRPLDSRYFAGVFTGEGAGRYETEGRPLWLARWQWNFLGRDLPFSQSDLIRRGKAAASVAVAGVWNRSRYTSFSGSGGGELEGFTSDVAERYDVRQALAEAAYHHRGFSVQTEYHWKTIEDRVEPRETRMRGAYVRAGFFPEELWRSIPKELEFAARVAFVDPDADRAEDRQTELTLGVNWFFAGHRNKFSLDTSRIGLQVPDAAGLSAWRVRVQWDVSF